MDPPSSSSASACPIATATKHGDQTRDLAEAVRDQGEQSEADACDAD